MSDPIRVGVVDSGWDRSRAEPRVLAGAAFTAAGGLPDPDDHDRLGHGAVCALEVLRWAPGARVLPVRVFGEEAVTTPEAVAWGIRWAAAAGARVICVSLGTRRSSAREVLLPACGEAAARGAVLVAAGPNAGPETYPAALPGVIGVWPSPDLVAGELRRRTPGSLDLYAPADAGGTSRAAAEVAGRLAALLGEGCESDPEELLRRLLAPRPA